MRLIRWPWFAPVCHCRNIAAGLSCRVSLRVTRHNDAEESITQSREKSEMRRAIMMIGLAGIGLGVRSYAALPPDYTGKPFEDSVYHGGPQVIPGRLECAYFDFG